MIVAEQKPLAEIADNIKDAQKVLVAGCGGCVTVCLSGGRKEADILATSLRILRKKEGRPIDTVTETPERQCDKEYVENLADKVAAADCVVIVTDHSAYDWAEVRAGARLLVDTRAALRRAGG